MSVRSKAIERWQFGRESVAGTGVAASNQPTSVTNLTLKGMEPKTTYTGMGSETPNAESQEKCWSEFNGDGPICYILLPDILNACLGNQASSPYTYTPDNWGLDTLKTLTIEKGSEVQAERCAYGVVKGFTMRFTQKVASLTWPGFGRKLQDGITITATPTILSCVPVDPKKVALLIGADVAGLAAVNFQEIEVKVADRWAPHFEGNSSQDSWEEPKKLDATHTITLTIHSPAAITDLRTASRNKELRCIRIKATSGLEFASGQFYDLQITAMCMIQFPEDSGETDKVVTSGITCTMTYDEDFGGFLEVVVTNA